MAGRQATVGQLWLAAAALLVACDLIENRKLDPPPLPPGRVIGGLGGSTTVGTRPATDPSGGPGGYGGGSPIMLPPRDAGSAGSGGAGASCGRDDGQYCVDSCFSIEWKAELPRCNSATGTWSCAPGWVLASTCPPNACANPTAGYCCDQASGVVTRTACLPSGYVDPCPNGLVTAVNTRCPGPPDAAVPATGCGLLANQSCLMQDAQCNDSGSSCTCQPFRGALTWACVPRSPIP